jgi:hypothetical protein
MPQFSAEETEILNNGDSTVEGVVCVQVSDSEDGDYVPSLASNVIVKHIHVHLMDRLPTHAPRICFTPSSMLCRWGLAG